MKTKSVSYSYSSSPNAARFGFPATGCYTLETIEGCNPPVAISGHASKEEAIQAAESLDLPWNAYSLRDSANREH